MIHWANDYIGLPYAKFGQGPDSFDCWGLVRYILRKHYNIEVPIINVDSDNLKQVIKEFRGHDEFQQWQIISKPQDGDVVLLSSSRYPTHIGLWLDEGKGGLLHTVKGSGVLFNTRASLHSAGWGNLKFYRYKEQNA